MAGKLRMYNVQFGDAFLLYGQGENLLVDLGSIQAGFNFNPVRDSIGQESAETKLSLLLTHFHKDHWSGLRNQSLLHPLPPFSRVYLPNIFQMRIFGRLDIILRSLLGDFLEAVILEQKPQFSLADLLREVLPGLPKEEHICFLSRGDVFQMGGRNYEVLWPRLDLDDIVVKRDKRLREFLERVDAKLAADGAEHKLWDTLEVMANTLLTEFAVSQNYQVPNAIWAEQRPYEMLYFQAQRLREFLTEDLRQDEGEFREKVRYYAEQLSKDWNRVSLVFQEQTGNQEHKSDGVLMTGDIPKTILRRLVNENFGLPKIQKSYAVIKAPHHGTDSHFCAILPRCQYLCISNGEGNRRYKGISEQYEYVYGCLGKKAEICCTNPRCDFFERKKICPHLYTHGMGDFYDITW